jgi:iron complex outermembrane receptor protein
MINTVRIQLLAAVSAIAFSQAASAQSSPDPAIVPAAAVAPSAADPATPTAEATETAKSGAPAKTGDIVVTATRRTISLMNAPVSVTVIDQKTLVGAGIKSTRDLERVTPSLQMQAYGGWLQPAIRGISSKGASPGDSSNVAIYVDGVYQPNQAGQYFDLPDVSRVEVLKGPQGSLYGQNAAAGAILVTTQEPSFTPTGRAYLGYGNYNDVFGGAFLSAPLSNQLAASVTGYVERHDGYRREIATGDRDFGLRSYLVRGKLKWQVSSDTSFTLSGTYGSRKDSSLFAGIPLNGNSIGYLFYPDLLRPEKDQTATDGVFSKFTNAQVALRGQIGVGSGTINTVTAYGHVTIDQKADADYSQANFAISTPNPRQTTFIQEINYASGKIGPLSLVAGVFYMHTKDGYPGGGAFYVWPTPTVAPDAPGAPGVIAPFNGYIKKDSYAAYAEANIDLLPNLTVTAGGRYSYERQRAWAAFTIDGSEPSPTEFPGGPQTFKKFTPRVSLVFRPSTETSLYATYSKGFKSGLINILDFSGPAVKPENVDGYEAGVRVRHGSFFGELSAYYYAYRDLQVSAYVAPAYIYENAAAANVKGAELTLSYNPIQNLTLTAGANLMSAKYAKYGGKPVVLTVYVPNAFGAGNDQIALDVTGRRVERAPKFVATASARYTIPSSVGDFSLFGSLYHNSGYALEPSGRIHQGTFNTLDGELSFSPRAIDRLRLSIYGHNLTDRSYLQSNLVTIFSDGVSYAPPRTFGARLDYSF